MSDSVKGRKASSIENAIQKHPESHKSGTPVKWINRDYESHLDPGNVIRPSMYICE
jgi:hypothetical protein